MTETFLHKAGSAIKAGPDYTVEGYLVTWGAKVDADLQGEYFTPETDLCLDWFPHGRPILYHHGMEESGPDGGPALKAIGMFKTVKVDDLGVWVQGQLNRRDGYARAVYEMIKAKDFGWSSGSVDHLVKVADTGEINVWPLIEGSITPTPAQPSKTTVRAYKALIEDADAYLKELDARVTVGVKADRQQIESNDERTLTMANKQAIAQTARITRALGYKLSPAALKELTEEVEAVAMDEEEDAAVMTDEYEEDPAAMMDEYEADAVGMDEEDDPAAMMDEYEDEAVGMDEEDPAAMMDGYEDDAVGMDEYEDDPAAVMDEEDPAYTRSLRRQRPRRSNDRHHGGKPRRKTVTVQSLRHLERQERLIRQRIKALELGEAPNQRGAFKTMQVTDEADRKGAYEHAFKAYMIRGEAGLFDNEKYALRAKGRDDFGAATMGYDAQNEAVKSLDNGSMKTYTSGSDGSWGYAVPEDWVNELNKNILEDAVLAGECKTRNTSSDRLIQPNLVTEDGRRAHRAQVSWPGESPAATDHTATEDVLSQISIPVHVMLISNTTSLSSLEDSAFNLQDEITEAFSEAVSVAYDSLIYSGNGQGKLRGIVADTAVTGSASTGISSVSGYVATGSASTFLNADFIKQMLFNLPKGWRKRAKWIFNSNTGLVISQLKDSNGNYLIDQRDSELSRYGGPPANLLNLPILYDEFADDIAADAFPMVLADLSRAYTIARRVEFSVRRFDDSNYAELDQVLFLGRARIGGQVTQPAAIKVAKVAVS